MLEVIRSIENFLWISVSYSVLFMLKGYFALEYKKMKLHHADCSDVVCGDCGVSVGRSRFDSQNVPI